MSLKGTSKLSCIMCFNSEGLSEDFSRQVCKKHVCVLLT